MSETEPDLREQIKDALVETLDLNAGETSVAADAVLAVVQPEMLNDRDHIEILTEQRDVAEQTGAELRTLLADSRAEVERLRGMLDMAVRALDAALADVGTSAPPEGRRSSEAGSSLNRITGIAAIPPHGQMFAWETESAPPAEVDEGSETCVEYALLRAGIVVSGPQTYPRWNETITLHEAAERWYPGSRPVTRTRTTYADTVTDWQPLATPSPSPTEGES